MPTIVAYYLTNIHNNVVPRLLAKNAIIIKDTLIIPE